jgi:hypothetical protein
VGKEYAREERKRSKCAEGIKESKEACDDEHTKYFLRETKLPHALKKSRPISGYSDLYQTRIAVGLTFLLPLETYTMIKL